MQRINTDDGLFVEGNPATSTLGTVLTKPWLDAVQEEIVGVIAAAGLELDDEDNSQLAASIAALITARVASVSQAGLCEFATDAEALAAANNRVVTPSNFSGLRITGAQQLPGGFKIQAFTVAHGALDNTGDHSFTFPLAFTSWCVPVLGAESGTTATSGGNSEGIRIDAYTLTGGNVVNAWTQLSSGTYKIIAVGV